jgi:hypothetical protein
MKKLAIAFLILALAASVIASAQPAKNSSMNAFWDKFKAAVIKGDKEAVFAMSALPIEIEYSLPRIRTKAQFMKNYKHIFAGEANAAKCFKTAKQDVDETNKKVFTVACGFAEDTTGAAGEPLQYMFRLTRAGWRFVGYDNVNE